jgi:hypothetical protein
MRERGFVGTMAFRKKLPTGWHLMTFQGSHRASSGLVLLTIDVGAITDKAWAERKIWYAEHTPAVKVPEKPTATWADPERIGMLRMGLDHWYEYAHTANLTALCNRIMADIDKYAVPYLEKRVPSKAK